MNWIVMEATYIINTLIEPIVCSYSVSRFLERRTLKVGKPELESIFLQQATSCDGASLSV